MTGGWIGVDLDGTLAHYDGWKGADHIGEPVPAMLNRVCGWLHDGKQVKIFTARVAPINGEAAKAARLAIVAWCMEHFNCVLEITHEKDFGMIELWDDRCVRVRQNTGEPCCDNHNDRLLVVPHR